MIGSLHVDFDKKKFIIPCQQTTLTQDNKYMEREHIESESVASIALMFWLSILKMKQHSPHPIIIIFKCSF